MPIARVGEFYALRRLTNRNGEQQILMAREDVLAVTV